MTQIPGDYINYKSSDIFTKENVPKIFLNSHNTRKGVYGMIEVLTGSLKFYGLTEHNGKIEQEIIIDAGKTAISPPQYWHKVELLTGDTTFKVNFFAQKDSEIVARNLSERRK